jgi:hypothetical protein
MPHDDTVEVPPAHVRLDNKLSKEVHDYRRAQRRIPSLAKAVHDLLKLGLNAAADTERAA